MGVPDKGQIGEIVQCLACAPLVELRTSYESTQHVRHFHINQMRGVQGLSIGEVVCGHRLGAGRVQQKLKGGRRMQHDQRVSRSARTASAIDSPVRVPGRLDSRARSSAGLG